MNEYKKLRNLVISTIRDSQRSYYKKTITANKSCDVWRAVNQSLGKNRKSSITSDLSPDAWNEHFASVGNKLCSKFSENDELIWRNNSSVYNFKFKSLFEEDVLAFINKLPSETNVDILGYDSCILKLSSEIICSSLTILFNMSLYNGEISNEWKKARVTPVFTLSLHIPSQLSWNSIQPRRLCIMWLNMCLTILTKMKSMVFVCLILLNVLTQLITNYF